MESGRNDIGERNEIGMNVGMKLGTGKVCPKKIDCKSKGACPRIPIRIRGVVLATAEFADLVSHCIHNHLANATTKIIPKDFANLIRRNLFQ